MTGIALRWAWGLLRRRPWLIGGMATSVAISVAFVAALGSFVIESQSSLTRRAVSSVGVDWQVQVTDQGNRTIVARALRHQAGVRAVVPVSYARVSGLTNAEGGITRTTGEATLVSLPSNYASVVPGEIRYLVGARHGVFLQQQTAANLGAVPGSTISVLTASGTKSLKVDGVVDLPQADSFFQVIGAPPGAGATAPPDNVALLPPTTFESTIGTEAVTRQFHVLLDHTKLPSDPSGAATVITSEANHLAVSVAGGALIGDNIAATLSAAREDAIYSRLLFLLLGLPGLALAVASAALLVGLRGESRKRETALLMLRGAGRRVAVVIAAAETLVVGGLGIGLGLVGGVITTKLVLGGTPVSRGWLIAAAAVGAVVALITQGVPFWRAMTRFAPESVAVATARVPSARLPWVLRAGVDFVLIGLAAGVTILDARNGYQVVVVPEGVPVASVNYGALLGPALAWPGLVLLAWRLTAMAAAARTPSARRDRPGYANELVAAMVHRRRQLIGRGAALLAAAIALGISTATFTSTYDRQSRLDVALTVGSDVSATALPGAAGGPDLAARISRVTGVTAVEPLLHRFAYVGPDLQDLFAIRPLSIARATALQDAFVPGSTIAATMAGLGSRRDGVLLSAETIRDYQLHPGDLVRLRVNLGSSGFRLVPFHVVGQISEFPTAPKDSFIVANADYIGSVTASHAVSTYLIASSTPLQTSEAVESVLGPTWHVNDVTSARNSVVTTSGLAATDLSSLGRLELGFAIIFAFACSGLALGIGIGERRRSLIVLGTLGVTARQRGRFLLAEGGTLLFGGVLGGLGAGIAIGYLLVAILRGIFDPPPDSLSIPWGFLVGLVLFVLVIGLTAIVAVGRFAARGSPSQLRDL